MFCTRSLRAVPVRSPKRRCVFLSNALNVRPSKGRTAGKRRVYRPESRVNVSTSASGRCRGEASGRLTLTRPPAS
ncbi:hypothetical protein DVJ83_03160 [Deinococcus wulumuqiensis]|uniref:Uncharacterized protein n=1 Tax=Deinococcus wulumuqiensis TaxID=980427 RepID=A0A345IF56_9DEIO|nr:hypothetical protein DVJ83_03160 [Deinococcus wulumuqiensis]